jgi:rare lipoprotein A
MPCLCPIFPPDKRGKRQNKEVQLMRKVILACAAVVGFTNVSPAGEKGIASYYQNPRYSGLIAAHKTLPLGARVKVFNLDNGRSAIVRIVDRGPFIRGRVIDVSPAAASALGFRGAGLAHVRLELI